MHEASIAIHEKKMLKHLEDNVQTLSNMMPVMNAKCPADVKLQVEKKEWFEGLFDKDAEFELQEMFTLSSPWLIGVRHTKCCSGPQAIPMLGMGSIVKCLRGSAFGVLFSMEAEPDCLNIMKWLLKDVDARRMKRLRIGIDHSHFGLRVGDLLHVPAGYSAMYVGTDEETSTVLFVQPLLCVATRKSSGFPAAASALQSIVDGQAKSKNFTWKHLGGFKAWSMLKA